MDVPSTARGARVERLANGLTVCLLPNRQAPLVTTAVCYGAGTRDEPPGRAGLAHFLEHLMFKGSASYGTGEIDRRTQSLGGSNNAFTTHDATTYYFNLASDRWIEALAIEADRMAGLAFDPAEVDAERKVILEEIAMYQDEPWDALGLEVQAAFFGDHPYGRPVLGWKKDLRRIGPSELAAFHRAYYRPDNAVLVVAGEVDGAALEEVERRFGALARGAAERPALPGRRRPRGPVRVERHKGEVPRLLVSLPAPVAAEPDCPAARLLVVLLAGGRASRLHRALVDEGQLCTSIAVDYAAAAAEASFNLALELLPGVEPAAVEERLFAELAVLRESVPAADEVERARRILLADWVFGHERVQQQALVAAWALALFDLEYPDRQLRAALACQPEDLTRVAAACLAPEREGVIGWALPRRRAKKS